MKKEKKEKKKKKKLLIKKGLILSTPVSVQCLRNIYQRYGFHQGLNFEQNGRSILLFLFRDGP